MLVALADCDKHGWAVMKEIAARTDGRIQLSPGTLYGLVKRLLSEELIAESDERPPSHWDDRRRRYYRLTDLGRRVAEAELRRMQATVAGAEAMLRPETVG